jgi:hypothetical protein
MLTRAGMTMHCTICGNPNHNKKGHAKWVEEQNTVHVNIDDEDYGDPVMLQHIFNQQPDPSNDPMHNQESMVYIIGQEVIQVFCIRASHYCFFSCDLITYDCRKELTYLLQGCKVLCMMRAALWFRQEMPC